MIGISTRTFDVDGAVLISELPGESDTQRLSRRISKTATLDGAVIIEDRGYVEGDRTFTVTSAPSEALAEAIRYLIKSYSEICVTTREGAFLAAFSNAQLARHEFRLVLEIKQRLDGG